jgi:hypothetical protein
MSEIQFRHQIQVKYTVFIIEGTVHEYVLCRYRDKFGSNLIDDLVNFIEYKFPTWVNCVPYDKRSHMISFIADRRKNWMIQ